MMRICRGIPRLRVDAVEDADQIGAPRREHAFEAERELRRENLLRVARADRRDLLAVDDPRLQEADAMPELESFGPEQIPPEIERRQPARIADPLIRDVVDREHARHAAKHGILREPRLQIDRRESRLPVVRVHDIGREAHAARAFERRAREQREPPRIVRMIAAAVRAVDAVAIEQRRLVDQPRARVRPERLFVDLDRMPILPELHDARVDRLARHVDAAIARQHDGHVMSEPVRARQAARPRHPPARRSSRTAPLPTSPSTR